MADKLELKDLLACVDRELRMRQVVYPRWVASKKLKQEAADAELERMRQVRAALIRGKAAEDMARELHQAAFRQSVGGTSFETRMGQYIDAVCVLISTEPQKKLKL